MNRTRTFSILAFLAIVFAVTIHACQNQPASDAKVDDKSETEESAIKDLQEQAQDLFGPLPETADIQRPIARLGKKLYYENSLSISKQMSCNTCHQLDKFGVDNEPTSLGHDQTTRGERNSPTVYNAYVHSSQFWDGRAEDLVEQAKGPVLNPVEMGMPDQATVIKNLRSSEEYQKLFAEAFPEVEEPVSFHNMAVAIAEFEKTLATPSRFDDFMAGQHTALTEEEQEGLRTFLKVGCTTCHTGPALGGQMFQKFGLIRGPYWDYTGSEHIDSGRVAVTGKAADKFVFKVPSLRNVAETAPYFHDGSINDLSEAIEIMGKTQLAQELTAEDIEKIEAFLRCLTGEIPEYALPDKEPVVAAME